MSKTFTTLFLAMLAMMAFAPAQAGSGGPDLYGYTWLDSDEPNGPTYVWRDISGLTNTVMITGLTDDNSVGPFSMGFDFHYYWIDVNNFKFGSNGWIGLGAQGNIGNIAHCFPSIPTQGDGSDNFVAAFMTDLIFESNSAPQPNPGSAMYWTNNTDTLIVQYNDVPWWTQGIPNWQGSNTFQVIFSGVDSSITFMYNDMDQTALQDVAGCNQDLTIGIENVTGNIGLSHSTEIVPQDQYAVKFYYPSTVTFQVPDATPAWAANSDNAGQIYVAPSIVNLQANVANVGNAAISTDITVDGQLQSLSFTTIWTDQAVVAGGLAANTDQTVTFPTPDTLTTPGQYYFNVATANASDLNPTNDNTTVEISVVDCQNDNFTMTYATGNNPDGIVSWAGGGGDDGAGVFFDAPGYPIDIQSVEVFISGDGDPQTAPQSGFFIKIYDGTGTPGALLDSVFMSPSTFADDGWVTVPLSSPQTIAGGGFYVGWIMAGDTTALGTEAFGPISRRTFEILNNSWAPYRQQSAEDFLVRVNATGCASLVNVDGPKENIVLQNYPNPASSTFKVRYDLPNAGTATFTMMDMIGRNVFRQSFDSNAGTSTFTYDASDLSNGTYFLSMEFNGERVTRKVVVSH